jgi:hypothetical protein
MNVSLRSRSSSAFALLVVLALVIPAAVARAQGYPPFREPAPKRVPTRVREVREPRRHEREPWMRKSLRAGVAVPIAFNPENLSRWFGPRPGYSLWFVSPVLPALDVDVQLDGMDMPLREGRVRRELGALDPGSTRRATIGSVAVGISVHPDQDGLRPFLSAAVMLPDVSQPAIFYTDGSGAHHTLEGTEIFAFDPGYQLGGGVEWRRPGRFGAALDVRLWVAPGRTREAVVLFPVRLAVSIPMPEWM